MGVRGQSFLPRMRCNVRSQLIVSSKAMLSRVACLFLNQPCPICDRPTPQTFCLDCDRQLHHSFQQTSSKETLPLEDSASSNGHPSLSVVSLGPYRGALKRAILAMKYHNRPDAAYPLGNALAQLWRTTAQQTKEQQTKAQQIKGQRIKEQQNGRQTSGQPRFGASKRLVCVVPIPLHSERQQSRGYNQAERISDAFCRASGLLHVPQGLQRTRSTQPQHSLTSDERQQNLNQVFQIGKPLQQMLDKPSRTRVEPAVLLIDDIYTTGATAKSAVATLKRAGISTVEIAVLARAGLQRDRPAV